MEHYLTLSNPQVGHDLTKGKLTGILVVKNFDLYTTMTEIKLLCSVMYYFIPFIIFYTNVIYLIVSFVTFKERVLFLVGKHED